MTRFILGVTGNIATGKSTVVKMLVRRGAHHIDADEVYHQLIVPGGPLLCDLVRHFGEQILAENGSLNRAALGTIVFSDPEKLAELDAITHPAVISESDRRAMAIPEGVVILDAVKLIESGHADVCDVVWLVTAPESMQIQRLMARNAIDEHEARRRIAAQPPLAPKRERANLEIFNNGTTAELESKVAEAWLTIPAAIREIAAPDER